MSLVVSLVRQLLLSPKAGNAPKLAHFYAREYGRIRPYSLRGLYQKGLRLINSKAAQTQDFTKAVQSRFMSTQYATATFCKVALAQSSCKRLNAIAIRARLKRCSLQKRLDSNRSQIGGQLSPYLLRVLAHSVSSVASAALASFAPRTFAFVWSIASAALAISTCVMAFGSGKIRCAR